MIQQRSVAAGMLILLVLPLIAQTRRVKVHVTDPLGARIAGADVSFLDRERKVIKKTITDKTGDAALSNLPVGDGSVEIAVRGFKKMTYVLAQSDTEPNLNVRLQPASVIVDYEGPVSPLPAKRLVVRVTNTAGIPIEDAHGWEISYPNHAAVPGKTPGELLFKDVITYPGIVITADGYQPGGVELTDLQGDDLKVDVILK